MEKSLAISLHIHVSEVALPMPSGIERQDETYFAIEILAKQLEYIDGTHTSIFKHGQRTMMVAIGMVCAK